MKKNETQPIRIAQIIGKYVGGGVEAVVMNYYRNIDKTKVQFDFICDEDSTNIPYEEIEKMGGKVILIPPYQKAFKYHKELKRVLKEGNYQIVHSHINTLSVFSLFAAWAAKVPIRIAHSHSVIINNMLEFKRNILKNILKHFSKIFSTNYFACSESAGISQFEKKVFLNKKVEIINNAVDLEKYKYNENIRKKIRKKYNIDDNTFVIGHVGRFVETKNHDFIVEIFKRFHEKNSNCILLLVGHGPTENKIRNKISELGLENSVVFLGQIENVNEIYQAMDLFLFPSLYEGLGMVLIEAQVSGLPCVASTNVPRIAKLVDNVEFVDLKSDVIKWVDAMLLTSNSTTRKDNSLIIKNCGYDIKEEARVLMDKYNTLLEKANKKKINVCHVVSGLRSGGVESMIYNYCSRMDKKKFNFSILYQHEAAKTNLEDFKKLGFELVKIPNKRKKPISNFYSTYKYLKNNKIDVVHCHMTLMNIIPLLAAKLAKVKVRICHSHGSDVRKKNIFIRCLENIIKKLCIKLSTNQFACGLEAGKYLYSEHKFIIINNALIIDKYRFNKKIRISLRKEMNLKDDDKLIVHVGRFEDQKNHSFIIEFMEKILKNNSEYKLVFIGDGPLRSEIEKSAEEKNIPNIIFAGIVHNVYDYYSAGDLFILPSKYEGLPVSALEAQVSGIKCLLSKNIDPNVVVIPQNVKLIENVSDIWEKEILTANNYSRNEDLKKFDEANLNIDIEYQKLERYYLELKGED